MIYWILVLVLWIVGGIFSYNKYISKWNKSKFEKIWFSVLWPAIVPLYLIHYIHNN